MRRCLAWLGRFASHNRVSGREWIIYAALLVGFIALYFHLAAILIETTNLDRRASDQKANMELATLSRGDFVPMRTNAVSNGFWPWVSTLVWDEDEESFFRRGKWLNITLSAVGLLLAGLVAGAYLPLLPACNFVLLFGMGSLLPRAVYFQPEPLYYLFFLLACVLGARLFVQNTLMNHALFGACTGLAYLAKPGVEPLLLAWLGVSFWRLLLWLWEARVGGRGKSVEWLPGRFFVGTLFVAAAYLATIAPRLAYAQSTFGDPFFSMPKFWMWQDDYAKESVPFLIQYGHRDLIRKLPPEEVPGIARYARTHTLQQAFERMSDGVYGKLQRFIFPEKERKLKSKGAWRYLLHYRGLYLAILFGGVLFLWLWASMRFASASEALRTIGLFVLSTFAIYTLAYGWYEPIGRGDRFMMLLYGPLVLAGLAGLETLRRRLNGSFTDGFVLLVNAAIFGLLLVNLTRLMQDPLFVPDVSL